MFSIYEEKKTKPLPFARCNIMGSTYYSYGSVTVIASTTIRIVGQSGYANIDNLAEKQKFQSTFYDDDASLRIAGSIVIFSLD